MSNQIRATVECGLLEESSHKHVHNGRRRTLWRSTGHNVDIDRAQRGYTKSTEESQESEQLGLAEIQPTVKVCLPGKRENKTE